MKLIDKDAVVEYIEQRYIEHQTRNQPIGCLDRLDEDKVILSFLNTFEVKEVDLEKEIYEWLSHGNITDIRYDDYCNEDIMETAKHFFELGLKAQNNN